MVLAFTWLCLPTANWGKNTYSFTVLNSVSFQCPLWWSPRVVNTLLPNSQKPLDIPLAIFATVRKQTFVHSEILTYWDTQSWGSSGNPMGVGVAGWFCGPPISSFARPVPQVRWAQKTLWALVYAFPPWRPRAQLDHEAREKGLMWSHPGDPGGGSEIKIYHGKQWSKG